MSNIFNLFLFLFAFWLLLMFGSGNVSWLYIFCGLLSASFVSLVSFQLKIIDKKSELLYLSLGFYCHFFLVFVRNFFSSLALIFNLAFASKELRPLLCKTFFDPKNKFNPAFLITSLNMTAGLLFIGFRSGEVLIHVIDKSYLRQFDLQKICSNFKSFNDDNLV